MPMEAGAIGIRPVSQPQRTGSSEGIQRREDGGSGSGFRPQTNVAIKTAIDDMAGVLSKISTNEVVKNVLQQAFKMDSTLSQGIGSTLESQRFSMEQLSVFARMLTQIGALAEKGFSMELSDQMELLLKNFKSLVVSEEGGDTLEPVLLSKAAFELIDSKTAEQLPQQLYAILSALSAGTSSQLSTPQMQESDAMSFLNQLVKLFMPRPSADSSGEANPSNPSQAQSQRQAAQSQARQFLQSMFGNLKAQQGQQSGQPQQANQAQPQMQGQQAQQFNQTQNQPGQSQQMNQSGQPQQFNQAGQPQQFNQPQMQGQPYQQPQMQQANQNAQPQQFNNQQGQPQMQGQQPQQFNQAGQPQQMNQQGNFTSTPNSSDQAQRNFAENQPQPQGQNQQFNQAGQSQQMNQSQMQGQQFNQTQQNQPGQPQQMNQPQMQGQPNQQPQMQQANQNAQPQQFNNQQGQPQMQGQQNQQFNQTGQPQQMNQSGQPQQMNQPQMQGQQNQQPQQFNNQQNQPQMQNQPQQSQQFNQFGQPQQMNQSGQPQQMNQPQMQGQQNQQPQQFNNQQNQPQMQNQPQQPQQFNQSGQPQQMNQPQMQQANQNAQPQQFNNQQNQPQMQGQQNQQFNQTGQPQQMNQSGQPQQMNQPQMQGQQSQQNQNVFNNSNLQAQQQLFSQKLQAQLDRLEQGDDFLAKQQQLKTDLQAAKTVLLKQPMQNTPETMQTMKDLAQLLLKNPNITERDTATLQNFVNNTQSQLSEGEARHLQNLLRLCQQNVPITVQQAAVQQKLPDLPRLWAFMQLCDMASLTSKLSAKAFKRAGRDVAEFANAMRQSMGGDNASVQNATQNNRSLQMMMPLYVGDNDSSYPTYLHVYDENEKDKETGEDKKETWLRICVLTDYIGAVELTFRMYENNQLDMRFYFSERSVANEFRTYIPSLKEKLKETSLEVGEVRIGSVGERMIAAGEE